MIAAALGALAILVGVIEPSEIGPIYFNPVIRDSAVFTWTLDANHCRYGSMSSGAAGGFIIGDAGYQDKLSIALHGEFRSKINLPFNRTGNHAFPLREGNGANVIDKFAYIEGGQTTSIRPEAQVHSWILGQQFYWRHNTINFIYGKNCDGGFVPNIRYIISNVRSYIFPVNLNVLNRDKSILIHGLCSSFISLTVVERTFHWAIPRPMVAAVKTAIATVAPAVQFAARLSAFCSLSLGLS